MSINLCCIHYDFGWGNIDVPLQLRFIGDKQVFKSFLQLFLAYWTSSTTTLWALNTDIVRTW